jgi:NhaP-type Na+/H+ or K+/H+ antiporter
MPSTLSLGRLIILAVLILLFRRLPPIFAFSKWLTAIEKRGEIVFLGWFGPIGIGALVRRSFVGRSD